MPTDEKTLDDEEVVARILGGETPWFEVLMRRHNQRLFRVARAIVRDDAEAEDAVQQAYIAAYGHLGQFAGQSRFATWLTRIAINAALARVRVRSRLSEVQLEEQDHMKPLVDVQNPESQAARREQAALLEEVIDGLPEIYRVVFMMREVQQLSVSETAECLEISEENVKVRLHRAKAMLREALYARAETTAREAFPFLGIRCDRIVSAVMTTLAQLVAKGARGPT